MHRDFDREFFDEASPGTRRRIGFDTERGEVTRFTVQLEYQHGEEWREVVRSDHDSESEQGHDVAAEGVHLDIFRDEEKVRTETIFPPMPSDVALNAVINHMSEHAEHYIKRFEEWHKNPTDR